MCSDQKQFPCLLISLGFHFPFIFNPVIPHFIVIFLMLLRIFFKSIFSVAFSERIELNNLLHCSSK